jgi:hypothetical protein
LQKSDALSEIGEHWRGMYFHVVVNNYIHGTVKFKLIMLHLCVLMTYLIQTLLHLDCSSVTHLQHAPTVCCSNQDANCPKPVALRSQPTHRPTFVLSHTQPASCSSKMRPKASALQLHANKEVTGLRSPPCADHHRVCTEGLQVCSEVRVAKGRRFRTGQ